MNGVLIIDKPAGLTSHDVVNRTRRLLEQRSVGHLGTLDPMATGVLPLVTGSFTRLAQFYTSAEKAYQGTIRFGFATDTYDAEGDPVGAAQPVTLQPLQVEAVAAEFRGNIEQTPPPFSAKKVQGVPAYKLARQQKDVVLKPVEVEIKQFEILRVDGDCADFRARVTSGTYMRSVAHDMGQRLGCGAHLISLRRTAVAEFNIDLAHTLEEVEQVSRQGSAGDLFLHPRTLLPDFPCVTADEANAARIRSGRAVNLPDLSRSPKVKVFSGQRELLAIATRVAGTLFHPKIVLCATDER
jgi:tRNA pseudouridine55 synthase